MSYKWIEYAKRIQALAQSGLAYTKNKFEIERYEELRQLSVEMMSEYTDTDVEVVKEMFASEVGYQTPKVDIRAVVFKDNKILMVKEQADGCWSVPGGWADIGYSPAEIAVKEVQEEAGFDVKPVKLLAVLDKKKHPHPPGPFHIYKIFILCEIIGGSAHAGMETNEVGFFALDSLPELSILRNTQNQMELIFEFLDNPNKEVVFD